LTEDYEDPEDAKAIRAVRERFSPEQRARIDEFVNSLSQEQIRSITTPMTEDQRETLILLMPGDLHPVDQMWLEERKEKRRLVSELAQLLEVAGAHTPWEVIKGVLISMSRDILQALVYRVERARGDAYEEGVLDGRRREEHL
jgi:hypothetical protein